MRLGQVVHVSIFYNAEILGFRHFKVLILVFDGVIVKTMHQSGSAGGLVKKNSPKYPQINKIHPNIPKIIPRYTLYPKFKESDIPNTRI